MADEEGGKVSAAVGLGDMIKLLIEDLQKWEEEYGAEHVRREAEMDRWTEMMRQIEMLTKLVSEQDRKATSATAVEQEKVKLTKLSESDDTEAYLKTIERMMVAYEIPRARWVFKLAPQLSRKAQKAEEAVEYERVKEAIWPGTTSTWKPIGTVFKKLPRSQMRHTQLVTRTLDMTNQWTRDCKISGGVEGAHCCRAGA